MGGEPHTRNGVNPSNIDGLALLNENISGMIYEAKLTRGENNATYTCH